MIEPYKLVQQIQESEDFKEVILANYIEHSDGKTMPEYADEERKLLSMGTYGVEDYYKKVNEYIKFLEWFTE
ncbi:hypothetical protein [Flagellimonas marina]|uniref:Uncharacterized protein n=1 Tax=Flagellimonas marina TaxID=1775168 RepID=A0ABV8PJP7_9FLAO